MSKSNTHKFNVPANWKKVGVGAVAGLALVGLQTKTSNVSEYHHRVTFKPQSFIPNIDFRGDAQQLEDAVLKPVQ